jgi:hypothetical protein
MFIISKLSSFGTFPPNYYFRRTHISRLNMSLYLSKKFHAHIATFRRVIASRRRYTLHVYYHFTLIYLLMMNFSVKIIPNRQNRLFQPLQEKKLLPTFRAEGKLHPLSRA